MVNQKMSPAGKDAIRAHILREIESYERDSSMDAQFFMRMLSYWVIGLLENHHDPELAKELFDDSQSA